MWQIHRHRVSECVVFFNSRLSLDALDCTSATKLLIEEYHSVVIGCPYHNLVQLF